MRGFIRAAAKRKAIKPRKGIGKKSKPLTAKEELEKKKRQEKQLKVLEAEAKELREKAFGKAAKKKGTPRPAAGGGKRPPGNGPTERKAAKAGKKDMADLEQPAGVSPDDVDAGMAPGKRAAFKANEFDKALKRKERELESVSSRIKEESSKDLTTGSANKMIKLTRQKTDLKASIADMKKRGGPRAEKSKGGKVGKTLKQVSKKNPGLSKLPTPVRNKMGYMKKGGKVSKPLGCGTAQRGFGKGPYKKRGM